MELYQLRSFVTVANEGYLTRAARRLFLSQPALSAHIKALEEELGLMLFTRTPQGMQLTKGGQLLKLQAEKSLSTIDELFQQAKRLQNDLTDVVKIGLNSDPDFLKISEFFSVMTANYPKLEFHLLQRFSCEILEDLRHERLEAGFFFGEHTCPEISIVPLRTCHLLIVGPVCWKDCLEQADWKEIAEFPWIWMSDRCAFRRIIDDMFYERDLAPSKIVVADLESILKTLVISGVGLTLMFEDDALAAEQDGKLVIWPREQFHIDLSFAFLRKREHDPVIHAILDGISVVWNITDRDSLQPR